MKSNMRVIMRPPISKISILTFSHMCHRDNITITNSRNGYKAPPHGIGYRFKMRIDSGFSKIWHGRYQKCKNCFLSSLTASDRSVLNQSDRSTENELVPNIETMNDSCWPEFCKVNPTNLFSFHLAHSDLINGGPIRKRY